MNLETKGLPCILAAEKSILAQAVAFESMDYLRGSIEQAYFSTEQYQRIWEACCGLFDSGAAVNISTVYVAMQERQWPISLGVLLDLENGEPRQPEPDYLIEQLAEKSRLREIIYAAENAKNRALAGDPASKILESLATIKPRISRSGPVTPRDLIEQYGVDELMHGQRKYGLKLPWPRLNGLLAGMHGGQLILMAAHTSQGKTSAALQIACGVADQGAASMVFSLEMEPKRLFRRMAAQISAVNPRATAGMLEYEDRQRERTACAWLNERAIWMDSGSRTVPAMISAIRQLPKDPHLGLVVVDYLQLIQTTGRPESRAREIGTLARELKLAAQEFDCPFLVLSQFNRESAKEKRRPELYDLKESGDVENHSDVVIILHATELEAETVNRSVVAYVPKQREGPRGREISMMFRSDIQRFEEVTLYEN